MSDKRHILQKVIDVAEVGNDAFAAALDLSPHILSEMLAGQREIPASMLPLIGAVMGVSEAVLMSPERAARSTDVVPAIWYKLRGNQLQETDRQYVLTLRQLAFYQHELELLTDARAVGWKSLFEDLRRETDPQASPTEQGRQAARLFRTSTGLDQGATGIGEVFRGNLRNKGILVIESSARYSILEGCSFYVGPSGSERPCIFANSYRSTWFRRNQVLMHELAHAIFDVEAEIASLDFGTTASTDKLQEMRADAFAQEALAPQEVLRHQAQRMGIRWDALDVPVMAKLVAATHVEQRLLAKTIHQAGLINEESRTLLESLDIATELRELSPHALSTEEYIRFVGEEKQREFIGRTTTTSAQPILLPSRYVKAVLDAFRAQQISRGKASRMLMIDEQEFISRFPSDQIDESD